MKHKQQQKGTEQVTQTTKRVTQTTTERGRASNTDNRKDKHTRGKAFAKQEKSTVFSMSTLFQGGRTETEK